MNNSENVNNNEPLSALNMQPNNNNMNQINNINPSPQMPGISNQAQPPVQPVQNLNPQMIDNTNLNKNSNISNNAIPESINDLMNPSSTTNATNNQDITPTNENTVKPIDDNRFINQETTYTETSITDLNVNGQYNHLEAPSYTKDPQVIENINNQNKKTIPITQELKVVIVIAALLLVFIIIMPIIFDLINKVRFR